MIKRFLALITALTILLSMTAPAYAADGPCITASTASATQGSSAYVQITAEQFASVGSVDFTLYYDAAVFTVSGTGTGSMIDGSTSFLSVNTDIAGQITVSAVTMDAFSDSGTLLYIYFDVAMDCAPKEYLLALTVGNAYGLDLQPMKVSSQNGKVTVNQRVPEKHPFYLGSYIPNGESQKLGDIFTMRLVNNNYYSGYHMASGDFTVKYDTSLFRLVSAAPVQTLQNENAVYSINTDIEGSVLISYASVENVRSYELFDLEFTVIGNVDTDSYIQYTASNVYDEDLFAYDPNTGSQYVYLTKVEEVVDHPDLWLETPRLVVGQQVTSTLMLEKGAAVAAGDFTVTYDPDVLRCVSVTAAPELSAAGGVVVIDENFTDGTVEFPYINMEGYDQEDIPLVQILWEPIRSDAGHRIATLAGAMVYDADFQPVALEYVTETGCIFVRTVIDPVCLVDGRTNYTCACGNSIDEDPVEKLGHDIRKTAAKEPDCVNIGWYAYESCDRCDYTTREEIPALGHDEVVHEAQVQTCLGIGWDTYVTCNRCDYSTYEQLPALGHRTIVSRPVLTDPLSVELAGDTPFTLENGKYYSNNHTDSTTTEFYITALYDCELTLIAGVSSEQNYDKLIILHGNQQILNISGLVNDRNVAVSLKAGDVVTVRYQKDGSARNYDDRGWVALQYEFVMAGGYVDAPSEELEPDCVNAVVCSYCDTVVKKALGHDEIPHEGKVPTCLDYGWDAYVTCSRCDYTTYETIPAMGHDEVFHAAQAPACTAVGWGDYITCSRCDYSTYVEIPALGHRSFTNSLVETTPVSVNTATGAVPFTLENGTYYSNNHGDNASASMEISALYDCRLTLVAGVSSEQNYDKLSVVYSNQTVCEISGEVTEQILTLDLLAGDTVSVIYRKDVSVSNGQDRGWVTLQYDLVMVEGEVEVPSEELEPDCVNAVVCHACGAIVKGVIPHNYQTDFQWNEDHSACQLQLVCKKDCGTQATVDCSVAEDLSDPEKTVHTATAFHDGQSFSDTRTCDNHLVVFQNWDGQEVSRGYFHLGRAIDIPSAPARPADETYTYSFAGWDQDVTICTGSAVYTAVYTTQYIDYTVTFKNWDGTVLQEKTYHYGDPVTAPGDPSKAADETYTYTFAGWDKEVVSCTGDAVYTATFTPVYIDYTVTFKNWDGAVLQEKTYHYGDPVTAPTAPSKAADETYTYTFTGWDKAVVACAGDAVYTAVFAPVYIEYTIVFNNWDGTVLQEKTYHYGDPVIAPGDPSKVADETYTYTFAGWDKEVVSCAGNAVYTATFTPVYIDYTVTFKNWDGKVLQEKTYHYGDPVTAPGDPSKAADETYTYTFAGWDKEVVSCAGDAVYTATFTPVYIDYTVTFKDWNGTVLQEKTYHYGDTVETPADPGREADEACTYTFAGWDKEIASCAGDATYTATYDPTYIEYTVVFKNWDGTLIAEGNYHYGDVVTIPETPEKPAGVESTYVFVGWDKTVVPCAGDAVYTAVFAPVAIEYTVIFKNWDGTVLQEKTYHYGDDVIAPAVPDKVADETYTYTFTGWDKAVTVCTGNVEYTAVFAPVYIDYTVTFKDWNGAVLQEKTYHYGDAVTAPADPVREADATYTHTFTGWDKEVVSCAGNAVYTATYASVYIDYTVAFKNWDGKVLQEKIYHYGDAVTAPATPAKNGDMTYTYTFAGWDKEVVSCAGNAVYTATFTPVYIDYTVTFKDWDGTVLQEKTYHYGDPVTAPTAPSKAADETYTYTFTGWDKAVAACAGDAVYTAVFQSTYVEYTVVFKNADGTVLQESTYHYGDTVTVPAEPAPPASVAPDWVFKGWDGEISQTCAGNAVYTAVFTEPYPRGDMNCDKKVTDADAVYLLRHTLFSEDFPIYQSGDFNGDGKTTDADAVYLLRHTLFPEDFPI